MNTRTGHTIGSIDTDLMIKKNESIIRQPRYLENQIRVSSSPSQIMHRAMNGGPAQRCQLKAPTSLEPTPPSHAVSDSSSGTTASSGSSSSFSPIVNLIFDSGSDFGSSTTCRRDAWDDQFFFFPRGRALNFTIKTNDGEWNIFFEIKYIFFLTQVLFPQTGLILSSK